MEIKKKFEEKQALQEIENFKTKIFGENILNVLDSENVEESLRKVKPGRYLLAAVMAGVVYFDEEKNCLVQKLTMPVESGEQKAEILYFKHIVTMGMLRDENTTNEMAMSINMISRITGRSKQIIEKIGGQDMRVVNELSSFFFS